MGQVKVYGHAAYLNPIKRQLSDTIHSCVVDALSLPADKRAHRFFPLAGEDFFYPVGRTDAYTIIEIALIEGRSVATKKKLIRLLFERIRNEIGIGEQDIEICIMEAPAHNWGFRGMHGDEITLNYRIDL